jgi:hypothetical protein
MRTLVFPISVGALLLATPLLRAQTDSLAPAPLFQTQNVLAIVVEAPFNTIFRDRGDESTYRDGLLRYDGADGSPVTLDVQVRTRGRFRLQRRTCNFPPLQLNFKKSQVENTLFHGQDKLKLVTHCQDRSDRYEQFALQEYLIYRTYSLFTDLSFRVRLLRMTYVDSEDDRDPITKYAFFIEAEDAMAARNGWEVLTVRQVLPDQMDQEQLILFELFQFFMGNTDWDPFHTEGGREYCCHNTVLVGTMAGPVLPVAYDFDWSGVIAAPYAKPAQVLGIRSVRQRRYWGVCRPEEDVAAVFPRFNEQREAIYALHRGQEGLDPKRLEDMLEYYDDFYEIINDARKADREIFRRCRGPR